MILEKIQKLCEVKGIAIAKLEKEAKIGNGTISRLDNSSPTVANLKKVADYFGVTIEELLEEKKRQFKKGGDTNGHLNKDRS